MNIICHQIVSSLMYLVKHFLYFICSVEYWNVKRVIIIMVPFFSHYVIVQEFRTCHVRNRAIISKCSSFYWPTRPNGHRWSLVLMVVSVLTPVRKYVRTYMPTKQTNDWLWRWAWWVTKFARLVPLSFCVLLRRISSNDYSCCCCSSSCFSSSEQTLLGITYLLFLLF